jgi:hypothetical protein
MIAKILSRTSGINLDIETLKTIVMFGAVGLTVSLICLLHGIDLSPGFL